VSALAQVESCFIFMKQMTDNRHQKTVIEIHATAIFAELCTTILLNGINGVSIHRTFPDHARQSKYLSSKYQDKDQCIHINEPVSQNWKYPIQDSICLKRKCTILLSFVRHCKQISFDQHILIIFRMLLK
jgi:hypothetical protein